MRRVLVVAYYFPPMGGSGVQRVAKFVKYLPDVGWQPTVLTIEPGGYFAYDPALLEEVEAAGVEIVRTRSWDPTQLFGRQQTVSLPSESRRRWLTRLSQFMFVPDNKIGWFPHAVWAGSRRLKTGSYDAILSSAPPYSGHLVAAWLSRRYRIPLVLDYRDDWVGNPRHWYPTPFHRLAQQQCEGWAMRVAERALTINAPIRRSLQDRNPGTPVHIVPQGFDPADFDVTPRTGARADTLRFVYSGIFYDAQTPDYFLRALAQLVREIPEAGEQVRATFVGLIPDASKALIEELGLGDVVQHVGYVEHREAVAYQRGADVLWMTVGRRPGAESISTSKLFEYFGARKPILALVPEGAARQALEGHSAAYVAPPDDVGAITRALRQLYASWSDGSLPVPSDEFVEQYDRRRLARVLAEHLEASTP
ncbi:MAG: glycosyltransferase [Bacteroidetes bacterium]|jgi:glycosyltransferase involved in cell wall biosynthesis|nr:glycosyltransferase [Bacteroidota bacterium]